MKIAAVEASPIAEDPNTPFDMMLAPNLS